MFSTSTAITPDLLVLDEVLGVGDAYFAQKSYDRMRELCDRNGATLLLVTHDIYSAVKMCDRVVWFDRGTIAMDGGATAVVKAYEESIRAQEERRLRLKKQAQLAAAADGPAHVLLEIQARDGRPQPSPVYFADIRLMVRERVVARLPLGETAFSDPAGSHLVREDGCWGEAVAWQGRPARPMLNHGSPFHKVVGVLSVARDLLAEAADLKLVLESWSDEICQLRMRTYTGDRFEDLGELTTTPREWRTDDLTYSPAGAARLQSAASLVQASAGIQGAGDIIITRFAMVNATGADVHTVRHGEAVSFTIDFRILKKGLRERAQVFIVVSRNNAERVCKFMTNEVMFDEQQAAEGVVEMRLSKMPLGAGSYSVAVEITAEGYIEKGITKFFSVDPEVYHCITHALDFTVTNSGWIGDGTIFEGEGDWTIKAASKQSA
jgi:hypothetical protein